MMLLVGRRCCAGEPGELVAETTEAGHSDLHANFGHRPLTSSQELPGIAEARLDSVLMWGDAEQSFKLANEMEWRDSYLPGNLSDAWWLLLLFCQQLPGLT